MVLSGYGEYSLTFISSTYLQMYVTAFPDITTIETFPDQNTLHVSLQRKDVVAFQ